MNSSDIREAFLGFFEQLRHQRVASSSLVPFGDPTLLFANAGMVQFKETFLGNSPRSYTRATSAQKCVRVSGKHNDLDSVGRTARHHTFFEMLGNFSFGDYFKREAIESAWELLTQIFHISPQRLWITVFQDDDEAFGLWQEVAGVPAQRIVRLGEKDNFWAMGEMGPCGPCSEIIYDRGVEHACTAPRCGIGQCDCERYLELWNLVFMQFDRRSDGSLWPLPRPSIDTGMGLERIASVLQGTQTNWETDLFGPLLEAIAGAAAQPYQTGSPGFPFRVIADHVRCASFLLADGVAPANYGRGYVLRRLLRRAVRFRRALGAPSGMLAQLVDVVVESMGKAYPELPAKHAFIREAVGGEEARFGETLQVGMNLLDELLAQARSEGRDTLRGEDAFRLYDTFGFPRELTEEVAAEAGMAVEAGPFAAAMERQRRRAREARRAALGEAPRVEIYERLNLPESLFLGYLELSIPATVVGLLVGGEPAPQAQEGEEVEVVLDATPFYPEGGGQVGDSGEILGPSGALVVSDTQRPYRGLVTHRGRVVSGSLALGEVVEARVDAERRLDIARNHTGTHLLHAALRQVLGEHVRQAGSLVAPDRLRFDFSHAGSVSPEAIEAVERLVNDRVRDDLPVAAEQTSFDEAMGLGALAFFGEKYGQEVRVVTVQPASDAPRHFTRAVVAPGIGAFSRELCGGTHLAETGQVGAFFITSESSIGAGLRRIEAVTGRGAEALVRARLRTLEGLARRLQASPDSLEGKVGVLQEELGAERKVVAALRRRLGADQVEELVGSARRVDGLAVVSAQVPAETPAELRELSDGVRRRLGSGVIVLGAICNERPQFVASISADLVTRGLHAGELVRQVAGIAGGRGGGRPQLAEAGGRNPSLLQPALQHVFTLVQEGLAGSKG